MKSATHNALDRSALNCRWARSNGHGPFHAGAREHCPDAKISVDPFHVVALAS